MIGRIIAHYEVTAKIGEGAMGEVFRATDTRLKRDVAIKMLSSQFASDADRVARLRREAEVLASVSHGNIGHIYGLESVGDSCVLVLELVEGPTLEDRIARGPLPLQEALRVAKQIAAALETAHESGIIHRDLKPGNVKLTPDGDVKVLDFGLAKWSQADSQRTDLTTENAVIGTPLYMSPEQVEGRPLDRRTDIWSFGCVLFEMLTGRRAFDGQTLGAVFAAITDGSIDGDLIASVPPPVRRLIELCLRKDANERLRHIGDARLAIDDVLAGRVEPVVAGASPPGSLRSYLYGAPVFCAILGLFVGWTLRPDTTPLPATPERYSISLPAQPHSLLLDSLTGLAPPIAISPDGRSVAFVARRPGEERRLWLRRHDDREFVPLPQTVASDIPFFSADGRHVGYGVYGATDLNRLELLEDPTQGSPEKIYTTFAARGASWGSDDQIIYASDEGLWMVSADPGGTPVSLTRPTGQQTGHRWPQILPGGKVLFSACYDRRRPEPRLLSLESGDVTELKVRGSHARYLPATRNGDEVGFLVYMNSGSLWAVRFDLSRGKLTGVPQPVVTGVHVSELGNPHFAVSSSGVLVYEPRRPPSPGRRLVWVNRRGEQQPIDSGKGFEHPRVSPLGDQIMIQNHRESGTHDVWTVKSRVSPEAANPGDDVQQPGRRLTNDGNFIHAEWSADGKEIIYSDFAGHQFFIQGLGASERRAIPGRSGLATQWRGSTVVFAQPTSERQIDLMELDLETRTVRTLVSTADNERGGSISPDGRWLAYVSDETGRPQVYVRRYSRDGVGPEDTVSEHGGTEPVWSHRGDELFFRFGSWVYAVTVPQDDGIFGQPQKLFTGNYTGTFLDTPNYDVAEDGRFVMIDGGWGLTAGHLKVHLHFAQELEQELP